jgi:hypothetical protein
MYTYECIQTHTMHVNTLNARKHTQVGGGVQRGCSQNQSVLRSLRRGDRPHGCVCVYVRVCMCVCACVYVCVLKCVRVCIPFLLSYTPTHISRTLSHTHISRTLSHTQISRSHSCSARRTNTHTSSLSSGTPRLASSRCTTLSTGACVCVYVYIIH